MKSEPTGLRPMKKTLWKRRERTILSFWRYLLLIGLLFMGMILYVWEQVEITELARDIDRLKAEKRRLENENGLLRIEIASLSSRERIEQIARERLGMVYPSKRPIVLTVRPLQEGSPADERIQVPVKAHVGHLRFR